MFLIWTGWGILAVLIPIIFVIFGGMAINQLFGSDCFKTCTWALPFVLFLSGIVMYYIGLKLSKREDRILIDKKTNEEVILVDKHDLFWIPLRFWGYFVAIVATLLFLKSNGYLSS